MRFFKRLIQITVWTLLISLGIFLAGGTALFVYAYRHVDSAADEALFRAAREGSALRLYTCTEEGEEPLFLRQIRVGATHKVWVRLEDVVPALKEGYVAVEDKNFFSHPGVDVLRSAYAAFNSVFHTTSSFGASTLTQQVIKNISGDREVTWRRKLDEILRACRLEQYHSKQEILEVYMNIVPMGENIVGVGAASERYFGKTPQSLTIAEAATLIGISNAPARYNPHTHPQDCLVKRNRVLRTMYSENCMDEAAYRAALEQPLGVLACPRTQQSTLSWFEETVLRDVRADLCAVHGMSESSAAALLRAGGLSIVTTVDPVVQKILEDCFENEENLAPQVKEGLSYAMCVYDSRTGALRGIIGQAGEKCADRLLDHCAVPHTPGSVLKPLALYAPLLEEKRIHAATVLDDVPLSFTKHGDTDVPYPRNYPAVYDGLISVSDALRLSKNTVAARLYEMRGAERIYADLHDTFGFEDMVRRARDGQGRMLTDLALSPLALGQLTYGVSLRRLTEAYTVFPAEGVLRRGRAYTRVQDNRGRILLDAPATQRRVFSVGTARVMNTLLGAVIESGTAKTITLDSLVDTAGKTGTSGNDRDRLFIGYTPYYTAGIWCGYDDGNRSVGACAPTHLRIWDSVMHRIHDEALRGVPEEEIRTFSTEGLVRCLYCRDSGAPLSDACAWDARGERVACSYFTPDNRPSGRCSAHVPVLYDTQSMALAHPGCPRENLCVISLVRSPERAFMRQIFVTDAQYMYRQMQPGESPCTLAQVAYFAATLPPGKYPGVSPTQRQFNCACPVHACTGADGILRRRESA